MLHFEGRGGRSGTAHSAVWMVKDVLFLLFQKSLMFHNTFFLVWGEKQRSVTAVRERELAFAI